MNPPRDLTATLAAITVDTLDDWLDVGIALKSLGETGYILFEEWNRRQPYSESDCRRAWDEFPDDGDLEPLYRLAAAQDRQRHSAAVRDRRQTEAATKAAQAAAWAERLWNSGQPAHADHPYLLAKQIRPVDTLGELPCEVVADIIGYHPKAGDAELRGRLLIAPVRLDDKISTVELIDEAGRKSALYGGCKTRGLWHAQALPEGDGSGLILLLAEGIATVLSARMATGHPAFAALSASVLSAAARTLSDLLPAAKICILADHGKGHPHAAQAAAEIGAALATPSFTAAQIETFRASPSPLGGGQGDDKPPTDFNDLHQLAGVAAVREQIALALIVKPVRAAKTDPLKVRLPRGYQLTDKGLFFLEESESEDDRTEIRKVFVCSPLRVTAETRSADQLQWGRLLEWEDRDEHLHSLTIPMSILEGDATSLSSLLADGGLIIGVGGKARALLIRYVKECAPGVRARCVSRTGWHDRTYILPAHSFGEAEGERVLLQTGGAISNDYRQAGTVADWRGSVGRLCAHNSRPMLAIGFALAAPLLHFMIGEESGGAHFRGGSSCGKSTALWTAASVYGKPSGNDSFRKEWRATGNGLEGLAISRNHSLLILDEMGQVDGKEAGNIAYMLANGQSKLRMQDDTGLRKTTSWQLLFLSSGEVSLADHMAAAGKQIKAGQENRLADIPAEVFQGYGIFEQLNGQPNGAALSAAIRHACAQYHGTVGIAWLAKLSEVQDSLSRRLTGFVEKFVGEVVSPGASGQVDRVAKRFGLVAFALELAGEQGFTDWEPDLGTWAVKACFRSWLLARGGAGDLEERTILTQVKAFFEAHGESRFQDWDSAERFNTDQTASERIVAQRVGFRRKSQIEGTVYYVLPEAFKRDLCAGLDPDRAVQVLRKHGWIEPDSAGKSTQKPRLPGFGKPTRCYLITPAMWESV